MRIPRKPLFLCFCFFLLTAACVHKSTPAAETEVRVLHSSYDALSAQHETARTVYILLRDQTNKAQALQLRLGKAFESRGFSLAASPSQAGYIVQCNIVFAGDMPVGEPERVVPAGYGKAVGQSGSGVSALIADVIIAIRAIPSAVNKKHGESLVSGAKRSKMDDIHLRMAACVPAAESSFVVQQSTLESRLSTAVAELVP